ncbi:MAG: Gfo/Idh/MocA family oxidoreductase [Firmicutes bacterium]|jgi:predicted dehydrogenase|nr:Gfo/Idh/MocA family oxidoreductase [Bacillota bacterium]MCL5065954.1 Gfo/Idh/MocA family oxidoreductase [Bacillota bacterium]
MTQERVRWGILGCAAIAKRAVIPGIQASETGVVVAVASREPETAQQTAAQMGIPRWHGSYEALLVDEQVEAVYLPLPNHLHREWTIRAARAGKHVLCEKPAALDAKQTLEMVKACDDAGVKFAEAFMYRHHPRYQRIREILAAGTIGDLRGMHATFTFNNAGASENIRFHPEMGGGSLYDIGCYPISAARLLLNREPEAATVSALFSSEHGGVDMMASGLLEFPGSVALTFDCGMWAAGRNTLEILGTEGRIEVPYAFLGPSEFWVWHRGERSAETFADWNPYSLQADHFGRSILQNEPMRFDPMDAVRNMDALDACLSAARERRRVAVATTV